MVSTAVTFPNLPPPSSSSAESISGNDDVLTEILVRTPVNSLMRFKSVSKHWLSLISTPQFSLLHTLRNPNPKLSGLLLPNTHHSNSKIEFVPLHTTLSTPLTSLNLIHKTTTKILQSCNGLFLCCSFPHIIGTTRNYYILNPTTKQYTQLESPPSSVSVLGVVLVFEPSKSPHYKVVYVSSIQIEIYSSETRCWRLSGVKFTAPFDMVFTDGVFWNGSIHWMSPRGDSLRFHVDCDFLGTMPPVPVLHSDWGRMRYRFFGESNGHLHLIEVHTPQTSQFRVFEMKRDYSEWSLKYWVNLDGVIAAFPEMVRSLLDPCDRIYYAFSVLGVIRKEKEDEAMLVLNIPGKVVSYKFNDGSVKELLDFSMGKLDKKQVLQFGCFDAYQYIETLAPV